MPTDNPTGEETQQARLRATLTLALCTQGFRGIDEFLASHPWWVAGYTELREDADLDVEVRVGYGTGTAQARNQVIGEWLATGRDWLLWIDEGCEWTATDARMLLASGKACVGGLCVGVDGANLYDARFFGAGVYADVDGLLACAVVGCNFKLVHRSAYETIIAKHGAQIACTHCGIAGFAFHQERALSIGADAKTAVWVAGDYFFDWLANDSGVGVFAHTKVRMRYHRDGEVHDAAAPTVQALPQPEPPDERPAPEVEAAERAAAPAQAGVMVLALQFWEGDWAQAMRLARFIAALEPEPRNDVVFCFVRRHDCPPPDDETLRQVEERFYVLQLEAAKHENVGYPQSCNRLAQSVFDAMDRWDNVKAVLMFEPDCVPVRRDWIAMLEREWDRCASKHRLAFGYWHNIGEKGVGHINGNMVVSPELPGVANLTGCPDREPWDVWYAPRIAPHWMKTRTILNLYRRTRVPRSEWEGVPGCALVHGVRDDSVWNEAQKLLT